MINLSATATIHAPKAIGPYSQAVRAGDFLFCSGQIPLSPETQQIVGQDIKEQTKQVCENLKAVLAASQLDFSRVVKTTCYLKDMGTFSAFNEVYETYFGSSKPARATVEVARLPKDVLVEIDLIAAF